MKYDSFTKIWETFEKTASLHIVIMNFIEFTINSSTQRDTLVHIKFLLFTLLFTILKKIIELNLNLIINIFI